MSDIDITAGSSMSTTATENAAEHLVARMERVPFTKKHWLVGAVLFSATFFDGYGNLMLTTALPLIVLSFHLPLLQAGVLVSASFWGQIIGAPTAGFVAEKFGRRNILLITTVLIGVPAILSGFAQDLNQLLIARAIQGVGLGAEMPVAAAMFSEFVRGKRRGLAVGVWESGFVWGGFVAPFLGLGFIALFGQNWAWRAMFLVAGLAFFIVFFRNNRILPESPRWLINQGRLKDADKVISGFEASARAAGKVLPEPIPVAQPKVEKTRFLELFGKQYRGRAFMMIAWIFLAYLYGYGFGPFVATLYVKVGGLPVTSAIFLTILSFCFSTPWTYFVAANVDRFGRKVFYGWGLIYAAVILSIGAFVVGYLHQTSWPVLWVITTLVGFGMSSSTGFYIYAPELFPTRMRAWATGVGSTAIRVAGSIGPLIVGALAASAFGISSVYIALAATSLLGGLVVVLFGPETKGQALEDLAA